MNRILIIPAVWALLLGPAACKWKPGRSLSKDDIKAIVDEPYIYAFPMLMNYKSMFAMMIYKSSPSAYGVKLKLLAVIIYVWTSAA
ncbi:MAG: hypothetical protein ACYS76_02610 [Planctomycetota bacterium]|jgi:hypothetical protein